MTRPGPQDSLLSALPGAKCTASPWQTRKLRGSFVSCIIQDRGQWGPVVPSALPTSRLSLPVVHVRVMGTGQSSFLPGLRSWTSQNALLIRCPVGTLCLSQNRRKDGLEGISRQVQTSPDQPFEQDSSTMSVNLPAPTSVWAIPPLGAISMAGRTRMGREPANACMQRGRPGRRGVFYGEI